MIGRFHRGGSRGTRYRYRLSHATRTDQSMTTYLPRYLGTLGQPCSVNLAKKDSMLNLRPRKRSRVSMGGMLDPGCNTEYLYLLPAAGSIG